jgi:hypothetical protein
VCINWYKVKSAYVRSIIIVYKRIIVTVVVEQRKKYFQVTDYYGPCNTIKSRKMYNIQFINVFRIKHGA